MKTRRILTTLAASAIAASGLAISATAPAQSIQAAEFSLHAIVGGLDLDLATQIPGL